jgi:hypothetical protein
MKRSEIIYQPKKSYTFKHIGELLGITKQRVYQIYWLHYDKIKEEDNKICDLCEKVKKDVGWREETKLCKDCYEEVKKAKKIRGQRKN